MSSLFVIAPYDYEGLWVFDDERVGLEQEPFVGGADTMIDALVADIPDAKKGFRIVFSASASPGYTRKLDWVRPELSGNVYRSEELGMEGWLCPALFKYFESAPAEILEGGSEEANRKSLKGIANGKFFQDIKGYLL